jgi:V/A-type H+-transporting ATPase subunit D
MFHDIPVREPHQRGYDEFSATPHLEEAITLFEKLLDSMLNIAEFDSKIKRLSYEILRTTRKIRVLEELVFPGLKHQIKTITQFIAERERESYFRLKRFKEIRAKSAQ